jgi:hypothetical protein
MKEEIAVIGDPGCRHSGRSGHGSGSGSGETDICGPAFNAIGSHPMRAPLAVFVVGSLSMATGPLARVTGDVLSAVLIDLLIFAALCGVFAERRHRPPRTGRTR